MVEIAGRQINRIGLGTNRLRDSADRHQFLREVVEAGVNFIDTAHVYTDGESERSIGNALSPFGEDLVIATKGGYSGTSTEELRSQIDESFERLQTETIALYYLHRVNPDVPIEESVGVIKEYVDAGRIESSGISEVSVEEVRRASSVAPIAAVQNEYNLGERSWDDVIDHCEAEGIAFVPFYPLRGESDAIDELASRVNATPNQVKLAWLLARSPVMAPIPGTTSIEHLRENLEALSLELPSDELAAVA
jgi:aryl-alcohol dehydrogenase-like predicted oxidoreductase